MYKVENLNGVKMATINPELTKAQRPERKAHFIGDMAQSLKMCRFF